MPPKKRALAETDSNSQTDSRKGKKSKQSNASGKENSAEASSSTKATDKKADELLKRPPHEYYCIPRPLFDFEHENEDKSEEDQLDEDELWEKYRKSHNATKVVPVAEKPKHQWVAMWETWTIYKDCTRLATFTDPDNFGMYIYNDFNSYGIQELIENQLVKVNEVLKHEKVQKDDFQRAWATMAALVYWLQSDDSSLSPWTVCEDGERINKTYNMIGRAFLTLLNAIDQGHSLNANGPFKDLALVMAEYLLWSKSMPAYGLEDDDEFLWSHEIVRYAHRGKIDLTKVGVFGMKEVIEHFEEEYPDSKKPATNPKTDKWGWKKAFPEFAIQYGNPNLGGERFNILKFSRAERAKHAFDKKDPLKQIPLKDLREGNIALA